MFRHRGKRRTFKHNLRLAALLSFIAGMVNITGVLSVNVLTTNVTGHFAFFAEQLMQKRYAVAVHFLVFILSFLLGAFTASLLTELSSLRKRTASHANAIITEIVLLLVIGICGSAIDSFFHFPMIACMLLFAMGMQNSLVTRVSDSVVRTTHLTGLFTDLGIELSQLLFYRKAEQKIKLRQSIGLRLSIIGFFFLGCVAGGLVFSILALKTLLLGAALLVIALLHDVLLFRYYVLIRKKRH